YDVTQTGLVDNIFIFLPSLKDGECVVDTIFTPSNNQTGDNVICLNTSPFVQPGHVPPTIKVENLVINSTNPVNETFEGYLKIKATGNGTQRVCIQGNHNKSPTISEVYNNTSGLHIFSPSARMQYDCVTDVSYIPPKEMEGQQRKICLQESLPGLAGEIRCYFVESLANPNLLIPTHQHQPVFIDLAIPDTLICYENTECWLPVTVKGDVNQNKPMVKFGHIDPTLSPGTPTLDDGSSIGVYTGNVSFTPSSIGYKRLCIQTADPVT
ncbi:hypothetical protein ACJMK2_036791, partial [Sinanodonta woodiana]